MGIIYATIPDDLDAEFRSKIAQVFLGKKGAINLAIKEAITLWNKQPRTETAPSKEPKKPITILEKPTIEKAEEKPKKAEAPESKRERKGRPKKIERKRDIIEELT